ncbi:phosphate transporter [Fomitiporia mediterranea MF3/22]|uniref:phosphate transporter n=1 Tax=Fomitiporia mediterranea (strain MF3/22) TaxID=694068 RepID=UPI000440859C|nr:phosphate transporter [Fomitiporia mediterranea MF3/22]EJD07166.1 phosphate transporter [Fomitiporia mediterranea MF3/22]
MSNHTTTYPPSKTDDTEHEHNHVRSGLEEYERSLEGRPPWMLTTTELKLLGIAGIGFFLDAYDLFIINPVATMLQYRLYGGNSLPANLEGFVKASANIGSVIGQFLFGYLADALGRRRVYGKELMLIIIATILCLTTPTGSISPNSSLIYLGMFRILLGVGVGGDYPMSATVTSDRAVIRRRGAMLSYIFANQGWGSFVGSIVTMIVLQCYKNVMQAGKTSKVDGVWRIVIGLSLIPAFATLYQRLTLPEARRYEAARKMEEEDDELKREKRAQRREDEAREKAEKGIVADDKIVHANGSTTGSGSSTPTDPSSPQASPKKETHTPEQIIEEEQGVGTRELTRRKKSHFIEFLEYFCEWRHAKILIGTSMCWFLLDIAFYGINLNQNVVLEQIGFDGNEGTPWEKLFKIATGNLIITALGFVPGYYVTVFTIEYLGRKWIQIQGFLLCALFLGILAGKFTTLGTVPFIVCFALLQFFFNFGPNTTTYCYPAEVFPTRFKAFAHGLSAASGKAGAIISALAFNTLSKKIGTPAVLWIFFACCIAGAFFTLLLPEVKGRDADVVEAEELRAAREQKRVA